MYHVMGKNAYLSFELYAIFKRYQTVFGKHIIKLGCI